MPTVLNGVEQRLATLITVQAETDKIDSAAVDGLTGTEDSLAYKQHEVEDHLHSEGMLFGKDPGDNFMLEGGLDAWQLTAGTGEAYGAWVQISDGDEVSEPKWDPHTVMVKAASANGSLYYIQFATGESGSQVVLGAIPFLPAASLRQGSVDTQTGRIDNTDKLWARAKSETNGATIDITVGGHPYPG
jgi:hypothetical protein